MRILPLHINFKDPLFAYSKTCMDAIASELTPHTGSSIVAGLCEPEISAEFPENFHRLKCILQNRLGDRINVTYEIRTTGAGLTSELAELLKENRITVCLLMDGPKEIHERNAKLLKRTGSHEQSVQAAKLLKKHDVNFYIGITVTSVTAVNSERMFSFFAENQWTSYAFWPVDCELGQGNQTEVLSIEDYLYFIKQLFLLWKVKRMNDQPIYIREFENFAGNIKGYAPLVSSMCGQCPFQNMFLADGRFFARGCGTGEWKYVCAQPGEQRLCGGEDVHVKSECKICRWASLCQSDRTCCKNTTVFCKVYKEFYPSALPELLDLLRHLGRGNCLDKERYTLLSSSAANPPVRACIVGAR